MLYESCVFFAIALLAASSWLTWPASFFRAFMTSAGNGTISTLLLNSVRSLPSATMFFASYSPNSSVCIAVAV